MNTPYSPITARNSRQKQELARELRRNMTPAEWRLWHAIRANRLHGLHFRRQQLILGFIADFYCHKLRLVVELDGAVHISAQEYDGERENVFLNAGIKVLRFTNDQVIRKLQLVLETISREAGSIDSGF